MSTITSNGTGGGLWSEAATWAGSAVPVDGDDVVIAAGDVVTVDVDTSGFINGLNSILVQSHASTPGMLRAMNGYDGILKIKSGSALTNRLQGNDTSAVCKGRVLANYSGLWPASSASETFCASQSGTAGTVTDGGDNKRIFTPAVAPAWVPSALIGESINVNGTPYLVEANDATTATLTTGPDVGATVEAWKLIVRPLPAANTFKILLGAAAAVVTEQLDCALYNEEPVTKSVRTYGTTSTFTANTETNELTLNISTSIILTENTPVYLSTSNTLPTGLATETLYYIRTVSGSTCKLSTTPDDNNLIDITSTGTGVHCITHGILNVASITANLITMACALPATPWANNRPVMFTSSGTYPEGIEPDTLYYICNLNAANGTFNIALQSGSLTLTLGTTWTGTLRAYIGSTATTCTSIAVLDDITSENTTWVPTPGSTFAETLGLSAVILADEGPVAADRQKLGLVAATAATMTLSAAIDSDQYPNSRIWLASRNVAIQCPTTTTGHQIVEASKNTTGGIFGEIRATGGTETAFYGNGIREGTSHTAAIISGCAIGFHSSTSNSATVISGCITGISGGTLNNVITIAGCTTGISVGTLHTVTTISGCGTGITFGVSHTITAIRGCSTGLNGGNSNAIITISGCNVGFSGSSTCTAVTISGCNVGISGSTSCTATNISGCNMGINNGTSCTAVTISGCGSGIAFGEAHTATTINGCTTGVNGGSSHTVTTISECGTGISLSNVILVGGGTLSSTTRDIYLPRGITGYGVSLQCASPVVDYLRDAESLTNNNCGVTIYDLKSNTGAAQPGYIGRWDIGGKTISEAFDAGTHDASAQIEALYGDPSPPCCIHVTTVENVAETPATIKHVLDIPLWVKKGENLKVSIYAKQVATGFDERAKFSIVDLGAGGSITGEILASWTVADNTDWQTIELASGERAQEGPLTLRLEARGQSKELYWFQVLPQSAGTGYTYGDNDAAKVLTTAEAAGTYQAVNVADVRGGTPVGVSPAVGTLALPAVGNVRSGIDYGTDGTELQGILVLPEVGDVRDGIGFGGGSGVEFEGTLALPVITDVRAGVDYGTDNVELQGTLTLPSTSDVRADITYGAGGTEHTGVLTVYGLTPNQDRLLKDIATLVLV